MIRSIKVELNAAFPNMPLLPFKVFHDSAAAVTVLNVPRRIVSLSVVVKNVSGDSQAFAAQRSGSAWVAVIPGAFFHQSGTSTRGVKIEGADEADNIYTIGAADLVVMLDNGSVTPVQPGGDGDMKHSEFADLEVPENMTQKQSNALIETIVARLKGTSLVAIVLCLASLVLSPLSSFASIGPDADHGDINPTTKVSTVVRSVVDGAARPLPKYLHLYETDDSYPDAAAEYYRSRGNGKTDGGCSSVRDGGFLSRNFDYPFDERAEFVVKMSAGKDRFASVGVAQVGTNLTEQMVTSGKPEYSRLYKWLPGATVDGINENGVACNINVVDGEPQWGGGVSPALHPLAAVRWILDNATNAQHAAEYIAANIRFPQGWTQNFHYMVADAEKTYIVEDGEAFEVTWSMPPAPILTNFPLVGEESFLGAGVERWNILREYGSITNAWYTNAYRRETNPPWVSDLADVIAYTNDIFNAWASHPKEYFRNRTTNGQPWWQTVHTSIYDITNRVLRVAVQETDDWYTFQVPSSGGSKVDAYTKAETDDKLAGKASVSDGFIDDRVMFIGNDQSQGGAPIIDTRERILNGGDWFVNGDVECDGGHSLKSKANRPDGWDSSYAGNLAALDWNGDLEDSGIKSNQSKELITTGDFVIVDDVDENVASLLDVNQKVGYAQSSANEAYDLAVNLSETKADISMISATDQTFSNAVMSVATGISTNDWAIIASVADWASVIPGGVPTGAGTLGAVLAALAAAVLAMKKKTSLLESDGKPTNDFATDLLGKPVAKDAMAYKVATAAGENRSVLVVEIAETATAAVNVVVPAPVENKVIDFEVWVKVAARSTDIPQINYGYMVDETFMPVTLIKKGGENPAYEKDAALPVTNIVHFTATDASGYTVIAAAFK